jgi:hypothetical protein
MRDKRFTATQMSKQLGCSASLIYKKLSSNNLQMSKKFSHMDDVALDESVRQVQRKNTRAGCEMVTGYLRARGITVQRSRVRQSIRRVDPVGAAGRWSRTVTRRTYSVPTPNALWHLDAHMKLVRWGFVTHGCIDGYSRLITVLETTTNNTANSVLRMFTQACVKLGVPSRVRCDRGTENIDVALFMNVMRGADRASCIAGKSVHNQRIERLWRDVASNVTAFFYALFYELEDEGVLDINNEMHISALYVVFLPEINTRMDEFRQSWNRHRIRIRRKTEHPNKSGCRGCCKTQMPEM